MTQRDTFKDDRPAHIMKGNVPELESLRGIAALIVVSTHFMILSPLMYDPLPVRSLGWFAVTMRYSPLRILMGGYGSVVLFFVLSGFVLSIKFWNRGNDGCLPFVIRRVLRIYPPYYAAIALSIVLHCVIRYHQIDGLSNWFNGLSTHVDPTPALLAGHALLIGTYDMSAYDSVIWSLVHEMRISLIFPLIMYVLVRGSLAVNLAFTVALVALSIATRPWLGEYAASILFSSHFALGALLARYAHVLTAITVKLSVVKILTVLATAILGCFYFKSPAGYGFMLFSAVSFFSALCACLIIVIAIASPTLSRLLSTRVARFSGRISYSFYLFHCVILLAALNVFHGKVPLLLILAGTFSVSVLVATLSFWCIEKPAIWLGHRLAHSRNNRLKTAIST
ncbi:acyltransferase [Paraburkholderia sp. D15]|uniref:acyltransferase family protein n=1 Tax=Paraburkholderia sp. D15 TaxID=2880218 RepID=UPI00247AF65D|nr:acyltransferase [Paraburkholderia sp. D15]WGS50308.1 acyltransferase [Paraburkholderia sp. D15]